MKGIILAGGSGSRLYPICRAISKQLIPIYDKPLVFYPLSTLLLMGIRDILLISTPHDLPQYEALLGDGSAYGVSLSYAAQPEPKGLAQAFTIGKDFLGHQDACLILGDNFFYGAGLSGLLHSAMSALTQTRGAMIFGCRVKTPEAYGILELSAAGEIVSVEEKPKRPKSDLAVPGLYLYDNSVCARAESLKPSARGEYEITDLNVSYLSEGCLRAKVFERGIAWLDTGTPQGLHAASSFVETVQTRQGFYIACPEEIAYSQGFITREELLRRGQALKTSDYGKYILSLAVETPDA